MSKQKIIILIGLIICLFLFGVYKTENTEKLSVFTPEEKKVMEASSARAFLEISGERYEGQIVESESVYEFMNDLKKNKVITFTEKNYTGMGKFIDSINGVKNNRAENWIYYVNDEKAQIGVSNYKLKTGDVVSWKLEKLIY